MELAIESLAIRALRLPHHIVIYYGSGGNSKGGRSRLRDRAFGDMRKWVAPQCFDCTTKEEFRKQAFEFYRALLCTVRESDRFVIEGKLLKTWTAGEPIAGRLPYGHRTEMLSWEFTGKFWEMNVADTPISPSINERGFSRRIIGIEKDGRFTSRPEEIDCARKIFEADEQLEDRIDSGDAVWCYFRQYLFPFAIKHTAQSARDLIMRPGKGVQEQTSKLMHILGRVDGPATCMKCDQEDAHAEETAVLKLRHENGKI